MNTPRTSAFRRLAPSLLATALAIVPSVRATDGNWNVDALGNWSDSSKWSSNPTVAGGAGSTVGLTFNIATARTVTIDGTSGTTRTVGILNIGDTNNTHAYTLAASAGNSLVFDNSGGGAQLNQVSTSKGDTISAPLSLLDNLTVSNAADANTLLLSGASITGAKNLVLNANGTGAINVTAAAVSNGGTITNSGTGSGTTTIQTGVIDTNVTGVAQNSTTSQLTLSGTNTFTTGVSIKKGTVLANAAAALGTGTTLLGDTGGTSDATLLINSFTLANNITAQSGSTGNTLTIAGNGFAAARLTGNLTLNKDVTFTVSSGAQSARNTGAFLAHSTGTITGAGAINLNITGNVSTSNNGGIPVLDVLSLAAVASTGAINNIGTGTGRATITGNITAASSLNQNSASSVLTLGGANSYSGATNVNAGVLRLTNTGALSSNSAVTVSSGGTLLMGSVTATAASSLSIAGNGSATATGALAGVNNSGYAGTVTLADDATISSDLTGAGTTFTLSAANSVTGTNKTLTVTGVDNTTISGTITTGSGGLVKTGAGILTLSGSNTFTGLTRLNSGTVNLNNANALGGGGNLTFGGGSLQYTASNTTDFGSRIVNSTGAIAIDTNGQSRTLSGVASGNTAGLTKLGSGTLTLSGTNAYTGITAVNTGNLAVSATSALPTQVFIDTNGALNSGGAYADVTTWLGSGKIATGSTGIIALTGNSSENINLSAFGSLGLGASSTTTYTGTLTPAGTTYRLGGGGQNLTLSGTNALTGANALIVSGPVILTGANNLSGATTVAYNNTGGSNTLTLSGANGSLASSAITVSPSATLALVADTTATVATRAASLTLNRGTLTLAGNATANSTDAVTGAFTIGADGLSTVTLTPNAAKNTLLTAGSYARSAGGTVLLRGTSLGANAFGTANTASIQFTTPNLVGNAGTGTDRSIFVGALGATATNGSGFGANGGLLTQDGTNGVRLLSGADYKSSVTDGQTTLDNVQLTSTSGTVTTTVNSATTINSLSLNSTTVAGANVQVTGTGTIKLNSGVIYANSVTATTANGIGNTIDFNNKEGFIAAGGSNNLILSGVLGGTTNGVTIYAGAGRSVTFSGASANTYTGTTTVNGGSLLLGKTSGVDAIAGNLVINAGASVTHNANNQIADTASVTINGGTWTATNETIAALTVANGGQFAINTGNNPGQAFVVSGNASVSGYGNNTASLLNTGTRGNTLTIGGTLSLADGGRLIVNSSQSVNGTIDGTATVGGLAITHRASGAYTAVTISPNGSQNSSQKGGQLILNGDVTFTGNTTNTNTVFIDASTGQGTRGNLALTGATPGNRTFTVGDGAAANDLTVSSALVDGSGGASGLVKAGAGTLALTEASTYTGGTTVSAGILNVTGSLADTGAVSVSGGTYTVGASDTVGAVSLTSGTINGSGTLTGSSYAVQAGTISASLAGSGVTFTKSTGGTATLSGTNTYTGATTVSNGTLAVSGSIAPSATTVGSGATLSLTGSGAAGAVTVNSGTFQLGTAGTAGAVTINSGTFGGVGTVNSLVFTGTSVFGPGNSPGTVTIANGGTFDLSAGTTSTFQFTDGTFTAGTFDLVTTAGTATGTIAGILNLDFTGTGYTAGTNVTFINLTSITGTFSTVNITGLGGLAATVNYNNAAGDVYVSIAAIPEPASFALLAGVGLLGFALIRRKTRAA